MTSIILKNGFVVDPKNSVSRVCDIEVENGKIAAIGENLNSKADRIIDCAGLTVIPGIIDTHLHLGVNSCSLRMTARAGVTTAVDMAGETDDILRWMGTDGSGINCMILQAILPGKNVEGNDPTSSQIAHFANNAIKSGACGIKLLGGHFPLTPEASSRFLETAQTMGLYSAWHAGTTTCGSDINGMRQAVEICGDMPLHLAHINAYCRGGVKPVHEEVLEAIELLHSHPNIISESYLSPRNGAPLKCDDQGNALSGITRMRLAAIGLPGTREGIEKAVLSGDLSIIVEKEGFGELVSGKDGVEAFRMQGNKSSGSFDRVNSPLSRMWLTQSKRPNGSFTVDAIGTDGGGIPRNVIVENGSALVRFGSLSLDEFAIKTSLNPARMLGLADKGHFSIGADADITVFDLERGVARYALCAGSVTLDNGLVTGSKGTVLCREDGIAAVHEAGLRAQVLPFDQSAMTSLH